VFERVYTMTSYYDGPREGIADFCGRPHTYCCPVEFWDDDLFELRALDEETLTLALEDWAIWLRWEDEFHRGQTTMKTHPVLPEDRPRHAHIASILVRRLARRPLVTRARGHFRPAEGDDLEVAWTISV
jgi:hypothetical protein